MTAIARLFLILGVIYLSVMPVNVQAQAKETQTADRTPASREVRETNGEDEEYNFSWLDPDKKVYVLQNRKYRKANRFAAFVTGGLNLSNTFRTEYLLMPRVSFWFNEQFGMEFLYATLSNSDNATLTALKNETTKLPFVRENRSYYAALFTWTPWYAKLNFFNKILYFDWFLNAGVGQVNTAYDQNTTVGAASNFALQNFTAAFFGTGQDFYINQHVLVRLDLVGMLYSAKGADGVTNHNYTNFDFVAGIGYLF